MSAIVWLIGAAVLLVAVAARAAWKRRLLEGARGLRTNVHALPGSVGRVLVAIDADAPGGGRVEMQGMEWAARSLDGEPIAAGRRVHVLSVEGVTLIVEPLE